MPGSAGSSHVSSLTGTWRDRLPPPLPSWMRRVDEALEGNAFTALVVLLTLVALFLDHVRTWAISPTYDEPLFILVLCVFVFFSVELVVSSVVKPGYFLGFFFWLDLVAAFSLVPDIPWFWYPMIGLSASDATAAPSDIERTLRIYKTTALLRPRLVRFLRMLRLVRIAKLFELCHRKAELESKRRLGVDAAASASSSGDASSDSSELTKPSQVGQHLSEQTTRKVVLLVLAMLFGIPVLQPRIEEHADDYTVREINYLASSNVTLGAFEGTVWQTDPTTGVLALTPEASAAANATLTSEAAWVLNYYDGACLYLRVQGTYASYEYSDPSLDSYRTSEVRAIRVDSSIGIFSIRHATRLSGEYAVITTIVVLALLSFGAVLFNRNNHRMVIVPIERMMATIVALQANPLAKASLSTLENDRDHNNETGMLERTLQKLTGLLAIGLGDAGSRMIQKCMNLNAEGDLDPLVDGTKMLAIFGFCDIRRFTDATECLKEDVMMYVNEIAAIVHSNVSLCDGSPNKNIGDAFLLVWRLPGDHMDGDDLFHMNESQPPVNRPPLAVRRQRQALTTPAEQEYAREQESKESLASLLDRAKKSGASCPPHLRTIDPNVQQQVSILADKALVSFLRIIVEIAGSDEVKRYANHPRIKAAFDDFEVTLGFGLHCGWAIEGPIGSRYKIDASYLSPHVNLSETLQDATKIYGTPLLVSGEFYSLLSPYVKSHCRRLDVVRVSGRESPINLYAFDIHPAALAAIIVDRAPDGYDDDAEDEHGGGGAAPINVLELRGRNTILDELAADRDDLNASSATSAAHHPPRYFHHELFTNPYLNAREYDFARFEFDQVDRETIRASGPIASYHLVREFRLAALQCGIPTVFFDVYASGLELYLAGEWREAQGTLKKALELYPEDQATKVLLDVMREHQFVAPPDWAGWHEV